MLGVLHLAVASPPSRALSSLQPNALPALSGAIVGNLARDSAATGSNTQRRH